MQVNDANRGNISLVLPASPHLLSPTGFSSGPDGDRSAFTDDGGVKDISQTINLLFQHPPAISSAMEPSWQSSQSSQGQGLYNNFPPELPRSSTRPPVSPGPHDIPSSSSEHRRTTSQSYHSSSHSMSTFLSPPQAPLSSSHNSTSSLPSFSHAMYAPYHSSSGPGHPGSGPHTLPHPMSSYTSISAPSSGLPYPISSPMSLTEPLANHSHRGFHPHSYHESPRLPGYSTSPGIHQLSPVSPTTHLPPPHGSGGSGGGGGGGSGGLQHPGSTSTSSSSFPSATRTPATLPKTSKAAKRRSSSTSMSNGSWDEDKYGPMGGVDGTTDDQPWGMPQDQYKALTPRDKKQVRNRIGARRFRAKRKDYVNTLEGTVQARDDEIAGLYKQLEAQQSEIDDLRARLGLPLAPRAEPPSGLGLTVGPGGSGEHWGSGATATSDDTNKS